MASSWAATYTLCAGQCGDMASGYGDRQLGQMAAGLDALRPWPRLLRDSAVAESSLVAMHTAPHTLGLYLA